ncbi:MAG: RNA 2',3'-cyclic phosphodiesterase [Acidobacteriota bacterium]|nr:RNA 2',3'-cyclic phosphodiesterase [Acidobacteriota bacterium]
MRLFIGIPLATVTSDELAAISARLRSAADGLRWPAPESWHITLQFLGHARAEQCATVIARLGEVRRPPVPIHLEGLSFFDRAGVFFIGVRLVPELLSLQENVTAATKLCGFVPEARPYEPHITLARSKDQRKGLLAIEARIRHQPRLTSFMAEEFLLYESFPGASGSRYEVRARFALSTR